MLRLCLAEVNNIYVEFFPPMNLFEMTLWLFELRIWFLIPDSGSLCSIQWEIVAGFGCIVLSYPYIFWSWLFEMLISDYLMLWWRCVDRWKMVLYTVLGHGQTEHEVEFIEKETSWGLSLLFFSFQHLVLPSWAAAIEASWRLSFEVRLLWSERTSVW